MYMTAQYTHELSSSIKFRSIVRLSWFLLVLLSLRAEREFVRGFSWFLVVRYSYIISFPLFSSPGLGFSRCWQAQQDRLDTPLSGLVVPPRERRKGTTNAAERLT